LVWLLQAEVLAFALLGQAHPRGIQFKPVETEKFC